MGLSFAYSRVGGLGRGEGRVKGRMLEMKLEGKQGPDQDFLYCSE